jgi:hypothetical protein
MIAHVVLFRPAGTMTAAERDALVAAFEHAFSSIPVIQRIRVGRRRNLGRFYDTHAPVQYEFAAVLEFDSEEGLRAYLDHPAHTELGRRFFASTEAALVHDFDMVGGSELRSLLET